ncbi:MAG: LPS export ABC transporter ATP-binding protein [Asticcacaulis sp.]
MEGLKVDNIGKAFNERVVVKSVSLSLKRGEVAGLLGPNGAGKTTCFYMITGLIAADYGAILLDGQDITGQPMYQRARLGVGYLPQETSIFRGMSVEDNVLAVVELREPDRRRAKEDVDQLLEELRISHLRKSPATALSGGERRRVEIARALASKPSFMLLDEPFAGIDPLAISDIREVISYLKTRGIGILITDHNVRETLDIIDRASIIHSGEVLFEGTPDDVRADPEVRRVYLGSSFH